MKKNVKIIFCDNAGENKALKENWEKNSEEIKFGFIAPGTPQQNGIVEWVFAILYSWMRVMMAYVGLHENLKTGIWPKSAITATKLENIMVNPHKEKCAYEKYM